MSEFVHLHNHTDYSLLDAAQSVDQMCNRLTDLNMETIAVTEHGNLFSMIPFYKQARETGIKPIIGCETYVAIGSRFDKKPRSDGGWGNNHLVLLAKNYAGYKNLYDVLHEAEGLSDESYKVIVKWSKILEVGHRKKGSGNGLKLPMQ